MLLFMVYVCLWVSRQIQCIVCYQRNTQADFQKIKENVLLIRFGVDFRVPNTKFTRAI